METDTITAPDAEEASLRELGIQTDQAQGREIPETPSAETPEARAPEPPQPEPEAAPPDQPKPEIEKASQRDETGKFTKAQKPETEYSKAQKEQERKDRSWAALQARKEEFYREQAQVQEQQRIQQLEAARASFQPIKVEGLTGQEYYDGYVRFKQTGDYENAARALETALQIQNSEQARMGQIQAVNAEYAWRMGMNEAIQANPEVGNPESPVADHLQRIISENGNWLMQEPHGQGFQRAAEVAQMLAREDRMQEMEDEIISLKAQLEKYQRKSQPGKGGYAAPRTGEKEFDEMDLNEMEAHLKSLTQEADNYR